MDFNFVYEADDDARSSLPGDGALLSSCRDHKSQTTRGIYNRRSHCKMANHPSSFITYRRERKKPIS